MLYEIYVQLRERERERERKRERERERERVKIVLFLGDVPTFGLFLAHVWRLHVRNWRKNGKITYA